MAFQDRSQAGQLLASALEAWANRPDVIVLGLPRGGVPVAYEVAKSLKAPLDVFVVRKLGTPGREELAMGAVASGGIRYLNRNVLDDYRIPEDVVEDVIRREQIELERRDRLYRDDHKPPELTGKHIILADDGLATGSTMKAAVAALRQTGPASIVVAVPVAPVQSCAEFRSIADRIVCLETPDPFVSVGTWYENFNQTTDDEVRLLLERSRGSH